MFSQVPSMIPSVPRLARFAGVVVVVAALWVTGCGSLQFQRPTAVTEADWITEGDSPQRNYHVPYSIAPPLEEAWTYNATAGFGPGSPLIIGKTVLVTNRKGEIHGIDLDTGKRLGIGRFGSSIEGTPVFKNGIIYVPVSWGGRAVQAYDLARGQVLWSARHAPVETGLVLTDDQLISVDVEAMVRAYGLVDGRVHWELKLGERTSVMATPGLIDQHHLVVADRNGRVFVIRPEDGSIVWTKNLGQPVLTTIAIADNGIYVPTSRGRFFALDGRTGDVKWKYETSDTTVYLSPASVTGKLAVFGGTDGFLRAVDQDTGKEKWRFEVDEAFSAAPLIAGEVVYAGGLGEKLYALDVQSGRLLWTGEVKGRIKSAMAANDRSLMVLTEPNMVYRFIPVAGGLAGND